jgi:Polyketide cyclase / dehydrase and lipid transport
MVRYNGSITVPYARARVWKLMADWTNLEKWDLNISRSERLSGQPTADGVGTKFSCTFDLNGKKSEVDYTCVKYDAEKMDVAQFSGLAALAPLVGVRSQDTLSFRDAEGGGTVIDAEFDLTFRGLFTPLSFVMGSSMKETGPKVMTEMDTFVAKELGENQTRSV